MYRFRAPEVRSRNLRCQNSVNAFSQYCSEDFIIYLFSQKWLCFSDVLQFIIYQSSTSVRSFFLLWSRSSIKRWISSYLTFLYLTFLFIIFRFWKMVLLDRVFRLGFRYKYPLKLILGFIYGAKACNTMNVSTPCLSIECILRQYLWISGNIGEYPTRKIVICGMHRILHMYEFFVRKSMRMGSLSADPISSGIFLPWTCFRWPNLNTFAPPWSRSYASEKL